MRQWNKLVIHFAGTPSVLHWAHTLVTVEKQFGNCDKFVAFLDSLNRDQLDTLGELQKGRDEALSYLLPFYTSKVWDYDYTAI